MAPGQVAVTKIWTFDASHQLVGHFGKCANVHGHTYKVEVTLKEIPNQEIGSSDEGFVMDFYHLKKIVGEKIIDRLDHAFLAKGDEPILPVLQENGSKVVILGFRSTCENMAQYICWNLMEQRLPVYSVKVWETPTGCAEMKAIDMPITGPIYNKFGACDLDWDEGNSFEHREE